MSILKNVEVDPNANYVISVNPISIYLSIYLTTVAESFTSIFIKLSAPVLLVIERLEHGHER